MVSDAGPPQDTPALSGSCRVVSSLAPCAGRTGPAPLRPPGLTGPGASSPSNFLVSQAHLMGPGPGVGQGPGPGPTQGTVACPYCHKLLRSNSGLKTHIRDQHTANTQVTCGICLKSYRNQNSLSNHMSLYHKGSQGGGGPRLS